MDKNAYSDTLLLPKTDFPLRANAVQREHLFRERCTSELYPWQLKHNPKDLFILHDGPPYANGNLHAGHAMNKILKDIVNRYKVLQGHKVMYRPGWDCHGLPIEMKALEEILVTQAQPSESKIRQLSRKRALREYEKQKEGFMSWGVMGDWDNPYLTLSKDYEVRQLRLFLDMIKKNYIYRQLKPVYWSPSSKSALAESELEYEEKHESRSIHVRFPFTLASSWQKHVDNKTIYALIWTTTPWTIPSNKASMNIRTLLFSAIAVHPQLSYSLVEVVRGDQAGCYVIGTDRLQSLCAEMGVPDEDVRVLDTVLGEQLVGSSYKHPLMGGVSPLIAGEHVTNESGTGLVHTAPGHGMEDYEACMALGIEPFSPVDDEGRFTKEVGLGLEGKFAFTEGNSAIIEALKDAGSLVMERTYIHKYPYDWRTKQPVMLRATAQWFANVENLQKAAVEALEGHIIKLFEERGSDIWWTEKDDQVFVAPEYRQDGKKYKRGYDTMDVWFDSGTSWTMLRDMPGRDPSLPVADVYLEGSDQHRGWFQSSLLTSSDTLVTHGFTLDENGRKMSKSLGNTIEPSFITHGGKDKKKNPAYGSDVLRLWVASSEYTKDFTIGPTVIAQVSDAMRKFRVTARFLLGNLNNFSAKDCVPYNELQEVDRYMLHELYHFNHRVTQAYDNFVFNRAIQHVQNFVTNDLSAFYFDVIKDRLYNEKALSTKRRMAQTVLYHILKSYTAALSPVACHTAEEIYENYRTITHQPETSVFKAGWVPMESAWKNDDLEAKYTLLKQLKTEVNQVLEVARQEKVLRTSQEADISIAVDRESAVGEMLHAMDGSDLAGLFLTANVNVCDADASISGQFEREAKLGKLLGIHMFQLASS
ncbi:tRNA synthetases class I-domain-containing protein [Radiomyces spectabilis]|uniref:tRNA synthetases class I-domain-containing protein n=1 Tax=Radiomyces spectabilis TaxID=64574 RepID=UPI002220AF22|nr:tRNA synthetases class I-domain-containing protein [Radiomyces spectabilis]KAI8366718.1 tRNA synthetases class I-domain-containing protein [Radiomyces spectabilis]